MQAKVMESKIFLWRSLRSCEFVARQEAMKSGEESYCQDAWGTRESLCPGSHPAHLCFLLLQKLPCSSLWF